MKKLQKSVLLLSVAGLVFLSSCTALHKTMKEPNARVEFYKSDFSLSEQLTAEATCVKILGIDFERLFINKIGVIEDGSVSISTASIPVIGNYLADKTANYALYELMLKNSGYDVVFYPQYEAKIFRPFGIGLIIKKTTVKVTARLGKLNK